MAAGPGFAAFAIACAGKDLRRRFRDPFALLLWIMIPITIGSLVSLIGGGGGSTPKARVLVVDHDGSFLSELLVGALSQDRDGTPFAAEEVSEADGRARIANGDGSALLVIPEGFGESVLREEETTLEVLTNPAQRILPGIVEETLSMLSEAVFYAHRVLPEDMQQFVDGPQDGLDTFPDLTIADFSVRVNQAVERISSYIAPPVIQLEVSVVDEEEDEDEPEGGLTFGHYFFPSMIFMGLFFMAQGLSEDVWQERNLGTLRRVVTTPLQTEAFLLGKLLASAVVLAIMSAAAGALGWALYDFALPRVAAGILWAVFSGAVLFLLMTILQLFSSSQRGGSLLTNTIVFPLVMIGGAFFPFEAMPDWMAAIGRRTPNGWALEQLKGLLFGRAEPVPLLSAFGVLVAVALVLFLLCGRRLRRGFAAN